MRVAITDLDDLVRAAFRAHGFSEDEARVCADEIVECEARGHLSHGVALVGDVARWREPGIGPEAPAVTTIEDGPAFALVEGNGGAGPYVAERAMAIACEKATTSGIAIVAARSSWAFVSAGYNVRRVAREGFTAIDWCGTASRVAPFGTIDPLLGTNPLGIAVPGQPHPVVLDMATTAIAGAEIRRRSRLGDVLPTGAAVDQHGAPTTNPSEAMAGAILPFGGHRGSGLAVLLELLGGALMGAKTGTDLAQGRAMTFVAMRPGLFVPLETLVASVEHLREEVAGARPDPANPQAYVPGDRGEQARAAGVRDGLEVDEAGYCALLELANA